MYVEYETQKYTTSLTGRQIAVISYLVEWNGNTFLRNSAEI